MSVDILDKIERVAITIITKNGIKGLLISQETDSRCFGCIQGKLMTIMLQSAPK